MNIKAIIYNNNNEMIDEFTVIKDDCRRNFDNLRKYCCNNYQYEDCKHAIDLLKDYGFNYSKNGIMTNGLETFMSYEFAKLKYIIEFKEL